MTDLTDGELTIREMVYYETEQSGGGSILIADLLERDGWILEFRDGTWFRVDLKVVDWDVDLPSLVTKGWVGRDGDRIWMPEDAQERTRLEHEQEAYDHGYQDRP